MSDYKLINSLLEDGSPESLLKLKMVVNEDFFNINHIGRVIWHNGKIEYPLRLIKPKNVLLFIKQFESKFAKIFENDRSILTTIHDDKKIDVVKIFFEIFKTMAEQEPLNLITCFEKEDLKELLSLFKNEFSFRFQKHKTISCFSLKEEIVSILSETFPSCYFEQSSIQIRPNSQRLSAITNQVISTKGNVK